MILVKPEVVSYVKSIDNSFDYLECFVDRKK